MTDLPPLAIETKLYVKCCRCMRTHETHVGAYDYKHAKQIFYEQLLSEGWTFGGQTDELAFCPACKQS